MPLDEALSRVVIDFSGRPGLQMHVPFTRASVGGFDVDLFMEFFQGFVNHAQVTLHIDNLRGHNTHHQIETVFKAFGRALRMAIELTSGWPGRCRRPKGACDADGSRDRLRHGNLHSVAKALEQSVPAGCWLAATRR